MDRGTGFTLVEMLIVLAIITLLVSISYPGYAAYVTKTRRVEGQVALLELMQQQERYYTRNNTYLAFSSDSTEVEEKRFKWWSGSVAQSSAYELRGRACTGKTIVNCIQLQAMPGTSKVDPTFKDRECETLALTSTGEQTAEGSHERCWP